MSVKLVADIIKKMSQTDDVTKIIAIENKLSFYFAFPVLVFWGLYNIYGRYYIDREPLLNVMRDSLFLLLIALLFLLVFWLVKNPKNQSNCFSVFYILVYTMIVNRMFFFLGPAVWALSMILLMISMLSIRRSMLVAMAFAVMVAFTYNWVIRPSFTLNNTYYVTQAIAFIVTFAIGFAVHMIIQSRFLRVSEQFNRIHHSEEILRQTLVSVGDAVITVNDEGTIDFMNPIAEAITGWSSGEAKAMALDKVLLIEDFDWMTLNKEKLFEDQNVIELGMDTVFIDRRGSKTYIELSAAPIKSTKQVIEGYVIVFRDASKKKEEHKKIEYMSYHDQLTGLYNRRYFEEALIVIDKEENLPISVIFTDVNGLKMINDAFGHDAGDELIQLFAKVLSEHLRFADKISRIGGDEFVILLPNAGEEESAKLITRINSALAVKQFMALPISISIGSATKNIINDPLRDVIKRAEVSMYEEKLLMAPERKKADIHQIAEKLFDLFPTERSHSEHVSKIAETIGRGMGMAESDIDKLILAGRYHDIGKIACSGEILKKPNTLTYDQRQEVRKHPEIGFRLLSESMAYREIAEIVKCHHENIDGSGYPIGLTGEAIDLKAQIIRVAESYDTLVSGRSYQLAVSKREALEEMSNHIGTWYDREVFQILETAVLSKALRNVGQRID